MSKRILFIGPVTNVQAGLVGGATISFGYLVDYFRRNRSTIRVLNTKRFFGIGAGIMNLLNVFLSLGWFAISSDILFLNSSRGGTKYLAPLVYIIAKLFRCKFVFRPFGGDIKDYTQDYGVLASWVFHKTTLKADILYLQTQELMNFYGGDYQLRTSRKRPPYDLIKKPIYHKRFIFLGFVLEQKGIEEILRVADELDSTYTFHIYGPIKSEKYKAIPLDVYKGILKASEVLPKLSEYDVLVLPTFYEGEGYPGAIIEAYSLGLPVITTRWKAIPEIVKDGETGVLIEPRSSAALSCAIMSFTTANYPFFSQSALTFFNDTFDEEIVLGRVRKEIEQL